MARWVSSLTLHCRPCPRHVSTVLRLPILDLFNPPVYDLCVCVCRGESFPAFTSVGIFPRTPEASGGGGR